MRSRDEIYSDILVISRQRVQSAWFRSDTRATEVENNHLALIPRLLHCDDLRRHQHYLDVDRRRYVRDCGRAPPVELAPLWRELSQLVQLEQAMQREEIAAPMAKPIAPIALNYASWSRQRKRCY